MKIKKVIKLLTGYPLLTAAIVLTLMCIVFTALNRLWALAILEFIILISFVIIELISFDIIKTRRKKMLARLTGIESLDANSEDSFPLPVVICSENGDIIRFNKLFDETVARSHSSSYSELTATFKEMGMDTIADSVSGITVECDGKFFNVFSHRTENDNEKSLVMYFVDVTKFRTIADEFVKTRPAVAIITIDNIAELSQDYRDSDIATIRNGIEKKIEKWMSDYPCFITKVSESKFYVVAEKQDVDDMIERKFDILDIIRSHPYRRQVIGATLSIGVGNGSDLKECEANAKLSLDMALGRGGDQAVVRTKDSYEFFGGVSKSVESNNKVKSRVVASALAELIEGAENVFIMGHRFPDFDAVGSAIGVSFIAHSFGKNAYIITDKNNSMSKSLIDRAVNEGLADCFVTEEEAKKLANDSRKNLLVIVDTHIKSFVEYADILNQFDMPVVIDHHRKAVDYIDNSVIFFHDPSASSTAEMVTELIEYIPETKELDSITADALISGIMLDTKNFILRCTSRTFEAAAFLKAQNADTIRVKKLFANDIENQQARNRIIGDAKKYKNCVIAVAGDESGDIRMISAQAADELLNISGVDASFVIFKLNDMVCVSARSYGAVNVQLLMEKLGGGGHQTMAAAQVKNSTVEKVTESLMHSIENYNLKKEV